jgi:hypothetical protein
VNSYNEIRDQINGELNRWVALYKTDPSNKDRVLEITTTGHSKGAAMSTIAALEVAGNLLPTHLGPKNGEFPWKVNNPNFASPRFAGTETSKIVEDILGKYNILRFINYRDWVPVVVAEITGSKHVGIEFKFDFGSSIQFLASHNMDKYAELAPKAFEKARQAGKEMTEVNTKMLTLKKQVQDMKKI